MFVNSLLVPLLSEAVSLNYVPSLVYAAITAGSLSILATAIDSVFDIGSNLMLFWINRKSATLDINKWPVGGSRLESIGNIVYGTRVSFTHEFRTVN